MEAKDIRFGVEFETALPYEAVSREGVTINGYHSGRYATDFPGFPGWKAERDASIHAPAGHAGAEIVSPILAGEEGIESMKAMLAKLNEMGARVNTSMGVHVTVDFPANNGRALARLVNLVARHEKALYALTGSKTRELARMPNGRAFHNYAKPLAKTWKREGMDKAKTVAANYYTEDRYHTLNLTHVLRGKNKVEFRVFGGTTNATKAEFMVAVVVGLVMKALTDTKKVTWEGTKSEAYPVTRFGYKLTGAGHEAVTRLTRMLGWRAAKNDAVAYGTMNGKKASKVLLKEMNRLAKKYDADTREGA